MKETLDFTFWRGKKLLQWYVSCIFIGNIYIIPISICFINFLFVFKVIFCFINPDYRLIRISEGLLCSKAGHTSSCRTLCFSQTVRRWMVQWVMNYELEIWRKRSWPNRCTIAAFAWRDWRKKTTKYLGQDCRCSAWDSNRATSEYFSFLFGLWGYWHCGHSWPNPPNINKSRVLPLHTELVGEMS
jgi:hypothetical protein